MATETLGAGVTSYITYGTQVTNGYAALSVVMWVKSDITSTDRGFFHTSSAAIAAGQDAGTCMRYDATGFSGGGTNLLKVAIDSTGKTNSGLESANGTQSTALQCLILTWSAGDRERLYINDVETTPTFTPANGSGVTVNADSVWMHRGGKDNANSWNGIVHELRIYNRLLSAAERSAIYTQRGQDTIKNGLIHHWHGDEGAPGTNVSSIFDRSGNGHTGTAGGTATPTFAADLVHFRRRRAA